MNLKILLSILLTMIVLLYLLKKKGLIQLNNLSDAIEKGLNWIILKKNDGLDLNKTLAQIKKSKLSGNSKYLLDVFQDVGVCIFSWMTNEYLSPRSNLIAVLQSKQLLNNISSHKILKTNKIKWNGIILSNSQILINKICSLEKTMGIFLIDNCVKEIKNYLEIRNIIPKYLYYEKNNITTLNPLSKAVFDKMVETTQESANTGYCELLISGIELEKSYYKYESYFDFIKYRDSKNLIFNKMKEITILSKWQFFFHTSDEPDIEEAIFLCNEIALLKNLILHLKNKKTQIPYFALI